MAEQEQQTRPADDYESLMAELMSMAEAAAEPMGRGDAGAADGDDAAPDDDREDGFEEEPELYFGSVDEFVREIIVPMYRRKVSGRGGRRWSAEWWRSAEAIARLEALWRSWEHLRLDPATGMSVWWRDHADYHMERLFDPDGPFAASKDENRLEEPLPYAPPPPGLFTDVRDGR